MKPKINDEIYLDEMFLREDTGLFRQTALDRMYRKMVGIIPRKEFILLTGANIQGFCYFVIRMADIFKYKGHMDGVLYRDERAWLEKILDSQDDKNRCRYCGSLTFNCWTVRTEPTCVTCQVCGTRELRDEAEFLYHTYGSKKAKALFYPAELKG